MLVEERTRGTSAAPPASTPSCVLTLGLVPGRVGIPARRNNDGDLPTTSTTHDASRLPRNAFLPRPAGIHIQHQPPVVPARRPPSSVAMYASSSRTPQSASTLPNPRKHPPPKQTSIGYPILPTQELVDCLQELGANVSEDDLKRPTAPMVRNIWSAVLHYFTGVSKAGLERPKGAMLSMVTFPVRPTLESPSSGLDLTSAQQSSEDQEQLDVRSWLTLSPCVPPVRASASLNLRHLARALAAPPFLACPTSPSSFHARIQPSGALLGCASSPDVLHPCQTPGQDGRRRDVYAPGPDPARACARVRLLLGRHQLCQVQVRAPIRPLSGGNGSYGQMLITVRSCLARLSHSGFYEELVARGDEINQRRAELAEEAARISFQLQQLKCVFPGTLVHLARH
jgi:hypothetical protein